MVVILLNNRKVTETIAEYIKKARIDVVQMSADLGIEEEKLLFERKENLSAEEFLAVCSYLNVKPEEFARNSGV